MKKAWKKKWIHALLSKKYEQGIGELVGYDHFTEKSQYCCLAVLCKVAKMTNKQIEKLSVLDKETGEPDENSMLTPELLKKFGLTNKQQHKLANKNDEPESFETIAKYIDRYL